MIADAGAGVNNGMLPAMYVDEVRIQQLFRNLVGNAIKHCRSKNFAARRSLRLPSRLFQRFR